MKQKQHWESPSDSPGAGQKASTLLEELYLYETTQFKLRAAGYALSAIVTFAYAVLNAEVWGRPEKNVVYEC
jgi:hypothetical protein